LQAELDDMRAKLADALAHEHETTHSITWLQAHSWRTRLALRWIMAAARREAFRTNKPVHVGFDYSVTTLYGVP
jgi:hypothetical protein